METITEVIPEVTTTETSENFAPDLGSLFKQELTRVKVVDAPESKIVPPAKETTETIVEPILEEGKAPEKKAETTSNPDDVKEFLKGVTPKTANRFNDLLARKSKEEAVSLAETIVAERLKTAKILNPESEAKYALLEKTNIELLSELRKVGVERSPEYQAKFVEGPKQLKESMASILKVYDINEGEFFSALSNPTAKENRLKLNELIDSAGKLDSAELADQVRRYAQLEKERAVVSADPELAIQALQKEHESRTKAFVEKLQSERKAALPNIISSVEKDGSEWFATEDGKKFKSDILPMIEDLNGRDLEVAAPAVRAQLITAAALAKPFYNAFVASRNENTELKAKLAKYEKGVPLLGGRGADTQVQTEEPKSIFASAFGYEPART